MEWDALLCGDRLRNEPSEPRSEVDERNPFESDYTRVLFSSSFRRLQDKAQVFPLDNSDFVRTRLTHSLEVSAIGRSIGISVENALINREKLNDQHRGKISAILATAGLVHDLGNPPFGHFGEKIIQQFFSKWFDDGEDDLRNYKHEHQQEVADFLNFDGNAQTFRLLHKLHYLIDERGYNLSCATLASILKYPRSSLEGNKDDGRISYKKSGYFKASKEVFEEVKRKTGIEDFRHPIAFLLEVSDDIAYLAADIEDAIKKGVLNYSMVKDVFEQFLGNGTDEEKEILRKLDLYRDNAHANFPNKDELAIQRFRIKLQGFMISSAVKAFLDNHDQILSGQFDREILSVSKSENVCKALKELAKRFIYKDRAVLTKELAGEKVISGLLEIFIPCISKENIPDRTDKKDGKLFEIISPNYRFITLNFSEAIGQPNLYERLLLVTDFISGMTDSYALDLYQRLVGIKL